MLLVKAIKERKQQELMNMKKTNIFRYLTYKLHKISILWCDCLIVTFVVVHDPTY